MSVLSSQLVNVVIYHKNCPDGFGAAFSAYSVLGDSCQYIPCQHGDEPPLDSLSGKNIAICDFSFPYAITLKILKICNALLIIDHHASAEIDLLQVPDHNKIFDMNHSGAYLAWNYFRPNDAVPRFIRYIEDKDLWLWKMPSSREFSSSLSAIPFDFRRYAELLDDTRVEELLNAGKYRLELQDSLIGNVSKRASFRYINLRHLYSVANVKTDKEPRDVTYLALIVNSPVLQSEIGNFLLTTPKHVTAYRSFCASNSAPTIDIGLVFSYNVESKSYNVSLRSVGVNVAEIAEIMGGGGHVQASGFNFKGDFESLFYEP